MVNEEDLETLNYDEPQEDLFKGQSIVEPANKVLGYDKFKKQQEEVIQDFNDQLINDAETIKYVDDINLDNVKENENLKIASKKISGNYRKLRKKRAAISVPELHKIAEALVQPDKKK